MIRELMLLLAVVAAVLVVGGELCARHQRSPRRRVRSNWCG